MASFSLDAEPGDEWDRAFELMATSFVTVFHRRDLLAELTDWLRSAGYHLVEVECRERRDARELLTALGEAFSFPEYYGRNLDAFNDCLRDVVRYAYGTDAEATGTVLILDRFDAFAACDGEAAHAVLDIFAGQAREAALIGHRMLCVVQSDDPHLEFEPVGAMPVMWNPQEWSIGP